MAAPALRRPRRKVERDRSVTKPVTHPTHLCRRLGGLGGTAASAIRLLAVSSLRQEPGCLIVDGTAQTSQDSETLLVRPISAILYRLAGADGTLPSYAQIDGTTTQN